MRADSAAAEYQMDFQISDHVDFMQNSGKQMAVKNMALTGICVH